VPAAAPVVTNAFRRADFALGLRRNENANHLWRIDYSGFGLRGRESKRHSLVTDAFRRANNPGLITQSSHTERRNFTNAFRQKRYLGSFPFWIPLQNLTTRSPMPLDNEADQDPVYYEYTVVNSIEFPMPFG
jgi:hypothetical protein